MATIQCAVYVQFNYINLCVIRGHRTVLANVQPMAVVEKKRES